MCTRRALLHYFYTFGTQGVNWVLIPWCEWSCDLFLWSHTVVIFLIYCFFTFPNFFPLSIPSFFCFWFTIGCDLPWTPAACDWPIRRAGFRPEVGWATGGSWPEVVKAGVRWGGIPPGGKPSAKPSEGWVTSPDGGKIFLWVRLFYTSENQFWLNQLKNWTGFHQTRGPIGPKKSQSDLNWPCDWNNRKVVQTWCKTGLNRFDFSSTFVFLEVKKVDQILNMDHILYGRRKKVGSLSCDAKPDLVQPHLTAIISNHDYSFMFT